MAPSAAITMTPLERSLAGLATATGADEPKSGTPGIRGERAEDGGPVSRGPLEPPYEALGLDSGAAGDRSEDGMGPDSETRRGWLDRSPGVPWPCPARARRL